MQYDSREQLAGLGNRFSLFMHILLHRRRVNALQVKCSSTSLLLNSDGSCCCRIHVFHLCMLFEEVESVLNVYITGRHGKWQKSMQNNMPLGKYVLNEFDSLSSVLCCRLFYKGGIQTQFFQSLFSKLSFFDLSFHPCVLGAKFRRDNTGKLNALSLSPPPLVLGQNLTDPVS